MEYKAEVLKGYPYTVRMLRIVDDVETFRLELISDVKKKLIELNLIKDVGRFSLLEITLSAFCSITETIIIYIKRNIIFT